MAAFSCALAVIFGDGSIHSVSSSSEGTMALRRVLCVLLLTVPSIIGAQQPATPGPQDIPQPVPGDVGLAGSARPDIARYLNARTASAPTLAPDGARLSYLTGTTGQPQLWAVATSGG